MPPDEREARVDAVASVLEAVAELGRLLASERHAPFDGRGLTRSQIETLFLLAHRIPPMTPARLATALRITKGAVTQLLDTLREQGLVESAPHPTDARSRILVLTAVAAREIDAFESGIVRHLLPRFARLGDAELAALESTLRRLTAEEEPATVPASRAG